MAVNVAMAAVITANITNALSVTSCALRSVIDAIPLLLRHSNSGVDQSGEWANVLRNLFSSDARQKELINAVPLRRMGTVDDIGQTAVFLASPLASYVSGCVVEWTAVRTSSAALRASA